MGMGLRVRVAIIAGTIGAATALAAAADAKIVVGQGIAGVKLGQTQVQVKAILGDVQVPAGPGLSG
jgi:hypothetical protein